MRLQSLVNHVRISQKLRLPFLVGNYKYDPLPTPSCIRLLELLPSADPRNIRCSLKAVELQDAPSFRALSYTWGKATTTLAPLTTNPKGQRHAGSMKDPDASQGIRRHPIICDGKVIKVTSNLRDALKMLCNAFHLPHLPQTPSYYWIDALCMNQGDVEERNTQVARMADVYKRADGVIVWLGKEDEFTQDALTTIRSISAIPKEEWPLIPYTSFYNSEESQSKYTKNLTFHNWLGFMVLINRPWFKRAWVCVYFPVLPITNNIRSSKRLPLESQLW